MRALSPTLIWQMLDKLSFPDATAVCRLPSAVCRSGVGTCREEKYEKPVLAKREVLSAVTASPPSSAH